MVAITAIAGALTQTAGAIGKAMQPVAKVKKSSWKAMKSGFNSVKSAASAGFGFMDAIKKGMSALSIIMLPLQVLTNIFAATLKKALMPAVQRIMEVMTDPVFIESLTNIAMTIGEMLVPILLIAIEVLHALSPIILLITKLFRRHGGMISGVLIPVLKILTPLLRGLGVVLTIVADAIETFVDWIDSMISMINRGLRAATGRGSGRGDEGLIDDDIPLIGWLHPSTDRMVPKTGAYWMQRGEVVNDKRSSNGGSMNVNINFTGGVIADEYSMARLVEKIKTTIWSV